MRCASGGGKEETKVGVVNAAGEGERVSCRVCLEDMDGKAEKTLREVKGNAAYLIPPKDVSHDRGIGES